MLFLAELIKISRQEVIHMEEEKKEQPEQGQSVKKAKKPIDLSKGGLLWTIWHLVEGDSSRCRRRFGHRLFGQSRYSENHLSRRRLVPDLGGFLKILSNFLPVLATNDYEAEVKIKSQKGDGL
jgi:hypothetical protein